MKRLDLLQPAPSLASAMRALAGDAPSRRQQALSLLASHRRWDAVLALLEWWGPQASTALLRPQGEDAYLFRASKCKAADTEVLDRLKAFGGAPASDGEVAQQARKVRSWEQELPPSVSITLRAWLDEGLRRGVSGGDVARVRWWMAQGADLFQKDCCGRTVIEAARAPEMLEWLMEQEAPEPDRPHWRRVVIAQLWNDHAYAALRRLKARGLEGPESEWPPLHQLVALGTVSELADALQGPSRAAWLEQLEARDALEFTPAMHAAHQGAVEKLALLRDAGADMHAPWHDQDLGVWVIESGRADAMHWWLALPGVSVSMPLDTTRNTPLLAAVDSNLLSMAEVLLKAGADPLQCNDEGERPADLATSRDMLEVLMAHGGCAEPWDRNSARIWLGQPTVDDEERFDGLVLCDPATASQHAMVRPGGYNGEEITSDFHMAMLESCACAFFARKIYGLDASGAERVWSADRFGQSLTGLPDGRWVQIGGEHEDGYDPDFCIYADVIVHSPPSEQGGAWGRQVFAYPAEVFPPTDFHTSTWVDGRIIVIGCLGYAAQRCPGETPVYVLDTSSFQMRQLECFGNMPGWLHEHRAQLVAPGVVEVWGGKRCMENGEWQPVPGRWRLDLAQCQWQAVAAT